jgi:hypothetical protein
MKKAFSELSKFEQEQRELEYHNMMPAEFDERMSRATTRTPQSANPRLAVLDSFGDAGLSFHKEAAKNFDRIAQELLLELTARSQPSQVRSGGALDPDIHIAARIGPEDIIGEVKIGHVDSFGRENAKSFQKNSELVGLFDESYKKLVRLAEAMQKTKFLRSAVSVTFLTDLVFEWLQHRYETKSVPAMSEYVLSKSAPALQEIELWLPIHMLHVQSDLTIGRVTLRTVTRAMMDEWREGYLSHAENDETIAVVERFMERERNRLQGFAAAVVRLTAEPRRASEIALHEAEQSVSLLRFYSPANFVPQLTSYCALLGTQHIDTYDLLAVREGRVINYSSGVYDESEPSWALSTTKIAELRSAGLDTLSSLLLREKRTEFQEELLAALNLYSRSSLAKNLADKLVYVLVALESMFLRSSSEPIMDKISERMAFLAGRNREERRDIVRVVKRTYEIRSSFIHHGRSVGIDEMDILRKFMVTAWQCLQGLIQYSVSDQANKERFFITLENKKWD